MTSPRLFVVAAPSGGGKTSLIRALLERDERVSLSISHTTRNPRPGEQQGVHYYFVDDDQFVRLIDEGAFLEHALVYGRRYGTTEKAVREKLDAGFDVLLDIDWQGARQVRERFADSKTVFILPPSLEALRRRLEARGQDSVEEIDRRMRQATSEISHCGEFDFAIVNDDFEQALTDLHSIIRNGQPARNADRDSLDSLLAQLTLKQ